MNKAAEGRDVNGYTVEDHMNYKKIKEDVTKYLLQVTKEVQESIDNLRNETIQNAKMKAWLKATETEEAAAACAAAVTTVPSPFYRYKYIPISTSSQAPENWSIRSAPFLVEIGASTTQNHCLEYDKCSQCVCCKLPRKFGGDWHLSFSLTFWVGLIRKGRL
jgi:hypothetical protein